MINLNVKTRLLERDGLMFKEFKFTEEDINETFQQQYDKEKGWTEKDEVKAQEFLRKRWIVTIAKLAERQASLDAEELSFEYEEWEQEPEEPEEPIEEPQEPEPEPQDPPQDPPLDQDQENNP